MEIGMDFESAVFSVIVDCVDDHSKRQECLRGVMDCVRRWGAADQLPIPARQNKGSAEQQPITHDTGKPSEICPECGVPTHYCANADKFACIECAWVAPGKLPVS
jgi:hypothetical protein